MPVLSKSTVLSVRCRLTLATLQPLRRNAESCSSRAAGNAGFRHRSQSRWGHGQERGFVADSIRHSVC
jgi:hypothetical protein